MARDIEIDLELTRRIQQTPALTRALAAAKPAELDAATVALAKRYAELLDEAAAADKYRRPIEKVEQAVRMAAADMAPPAAEALENAWSKLQSALAEHSVASDLGPKLLAALQQLGLTPASRASKSGNPDAPGNVSTLPTPLQALQGAASSRYGRSAPA